MFQALGLNETALAVYRALLESPELDLERLSETLGLPVGELAGYLTNLQNLGFLRHSHVNPTNMRTESPQVAFERVLGRREQELFRAQAELSRARSEAAALVDDYHRRLQTARHGEFERLVGTDQIVSRVIELGQSTEVSVDSIVTRAPLPHMLGQARSDEEPMLARGVRIRTLYPAAARHVEEIVEYARWFEEHGGQTRTSLTVPVRVLIYDEKIAVVTSDPHDFGSGAVVLNTPGAVAALQALFDLLWDSGTDLPADEDVAEDLRADERELLQLLMRGMKDEAIARFLGISIRTVRRMINVLSSRVDASSRFELGARAVALGWL